MNRRTIGKSVGAFIVAGVLLALWPIRCPAEEVTRFDPAKAEVKRDDSQWKIVSGDVLVRTFYSEQSARQALEIIRFYKMDSRRTLGPMEYYLVSDQAPVGSMKEEDSSAFETDKVEASKQTNAASPEKGATASTSWKVVQGDRWLLNFGDNEEQARVAATLIRKYRFSHIAYAGKPGRQMMYFYADGKASEKASPVAAPAEAPKVATPAAPPVAASQPAVKDGKAILTVRVIEGTTTPARDPVVTVRSLKEGAAPQAKSENPTSFTLEPGAYEVTARVGSAGDVPPRRIVLQPGEVQELVIRTGTGTMEIKFTAGKKPIPTIGVVQLRAGGKIVAALAETTAKFQAMEGPYTVRVGLGSNQYIDVEGLAIEAGKTSSHAIDVPCAVVSVRAKGGQYAQGKRAFIQVDAGGKMVAALMEVPSKFQLLAGQYSVYVREDAKKCGLKYIEVKPGEDVDLTLDADAPNQEPPKVEAEKPWPPKSPPAPAGKEVSQKVQVFTQGGKLTAQTRDDKSPRLVVPGNEYTLKSGTVLEATRAPVDLVLAGGGRISLDANTRVCVGLYDNGILVAQQTGKTWHAVRRPKEGEYFYSVITPRVRYTAVGTDFGVALTPGSSYVCTYTGTVIPRGTVTERDGTVVPVVEWVPGGILCQPPPESSYWTQPPAGCVVDGKLVPVVEITDPHTGEPISSTSDAVPSGLSCGTPAAGIGGAIGGSIGAGRQGTFTYTQEDRRYPVDGSAPVDSIQRLSYYGVKPDISVITGRDSWADRNSQLTRDAAALERAHREGRLTDAQYRQKLRELYERGRALASEMPPIRFDPNGPHRVAVEGLRHVQNRIHSMRPEDDYYKFWDNKLPGGVAGYDVFVNSIGDDGIVSDAQWPYAIQLMRAMGVPFTTDR